jgi:putative membrane protein
MLKWFNRGFAALVLLAITTSCSNVPPPQPAAIGGRQPLPRVPPSPASITNSGYVTQAASLDLFIIRSSELASVRSVSGNIRDFARGEVRAHEGTSAQLSFAGRRLNLLPPATLTPQFAAMLGDLEASPRFDRTYVTQQIAVHQQALKLHNAYALSGESPTLRSIASAAMPIIQRHMRLLGYL